MNFSKALAFGVVLVCFYASAQAANIHRAKVGKDKKNLDVNFGGWELSGEDVVARKLKASRDDTRAKLISQGLNFDAGVNGNKVVAKDNVRKLKTGAALDETNNKVVANDGEHKVDAGAKDGAGMASDGEGNRVSGRAANGLANGAVGDQKARAGHKGDSVLANDGTNKVDGRLVKKGDDVVGGGANQGTNRATMKNKKDSVDLVANNQYQLDADKITDNKFRANATNPKNGRQERFGLDSASQTDKNGAGRVQYNRDTLNYNMQRQGTDNAYIVANDPKKSLFKTATTVNCTAVRDGESECVDESGESVGKVVIVNEHEANIYGKDGFAIARAEVEKVGEEQYVAKIQQGLFQARTKSIKKYDCAKSEVTNKITLHDDLEIKPDSTVNADGSESFEWPSCFNVSVSVDIAEDIDINRVAVEYNVHVLPLGTMQCMDSLNCGRKCYYCHACEKAQRKQLEWTGFGEVCREQQSGTKTITMRVCPEKEDIKGLQCSGFSRHVLGNDYYKYDGAINAQVRAWLRPENEITIRDQIVTGKFPIFQKNLLEAEFRLKNPTRALSAVEPYELLEFYMQKHEQLAACKAAKLDYGLSGEKVPSNLMLDFFTQTGNGQQYKLLADKPCEEWTKAQKEQYEAMKAEANNGAARTNFFS